MIKIEKTTTSSYKFFFNNIHLGDAIMDVDGYYYFWFEKNISGCWGSNSLRTISDKLDELNKECDDKIISELGK
jgi:hypothetical protein